MPTVPSISGPAQSAPTSPTGGIGVGSGMGGGAGALGGGSIMGIMLAFTIMNEIQKSKRNGRRKRSGRGISPLQISSAAQYLRNMMGENGEAFAIAHALTIQPQKRRLDFSYQDSQIEDNSVENGSFRYSRQPKSTTKSRQSIKSIKLPIKNNPNWAGELAEILLNITGGNLSKINPYNLSPKKYLDLQKAIVQSNDPDTETEPKRDYFLVQVVFRQVFPVGNKFGSEENLQSGQEICKNVSLECTIDANYQPKWLYKDEKLKIDGEGFYRDAEITTSNSSMNGNKLTFKYCVKDMGNKSTYDGLQNRGILVEVESRPVLIRVEKKKNGKPDWKKWTEHLPEKGEKIVLDFQGQTWDWDKRDKALKAKQYDD